MSPLSRGSEESEDDDSDDDGQVLVAADPQGELVANGVGDSDDDAESCPICLNTFRDQAVGTPEGCAHYFCLDCILEWAKVRAAPASCRRPARPARGLLSVARVPAGLGLWGAPVRSAAGGRGRRC